MDVVQDSLKKAWRHVNEAMILDSSFMDFGTMITSDTFNDPFIGGFDSGDYPPLNFPLPQLSPLKVKVFPSELQDRLKQMQCTCQMGTFPEIGRAWLSVDNEIFLWSYEENNEITFFNGVRELVVTIGLVKPKKNVFQNHIYYLLCVVTPVEIILFGLTFLHSGFPGDISFKKMDIQILSEPLFLVPTDNISMSCIEATKNGRIFLAGKDGNLYELNYQGDYGWFGRRSCRKINHSTSFSSYIIPRFVTSYIKDEDSLVQICLDETRNLLYTCSSKGNIELYYLGIHGTQLNKIAYLTHDSNMKKIQAIIKNMEKNKLAPIVSMSCIPSSHSEKVHLVAVTQSGLRLYFTTKVYPDQLEERNSPPNILNLVHVRLPPGFLNVSIQPSQVYLNQQMTNVNSILFSQGSYLFTCSNSQLESADFINFFSNDSFPFANHLCETFEILQPAGKLWSVKELETQPENLSQLVKSDPIPVSNNLNGLNEVFSPPDPPPFVTQTYLANKKFIICSSIGICIVSKLSAPDQLCHLLTNFSLDSDQVKEYFKLMKEQALISCLEVLISKKASHIQMKEHVLKAYQVYKLSCSPTSNNEQNSNSLPNQVSKNFQISDLSSNNLGLPNTSLNSRSLFLFVARLLRPVWIKPIVIPIFHKESNSTFLSSRLSSHQIMIVLDKLYSFKSLIISNPSILQTYPSNFGIHQSSNSFIEQHNFAHLEQFNSFKNPLDFNPSFSQLGPLKEIKEEAISLNQLGFLVDLSSQCLSVCKILADHQFHLIASKLSEENQQSLLDTPFHQLLCSSRQLIKQLVNALLEFYIDDNATTDTVSSRLREQSPSFHSSLDQAQAKGNEFIKAAKLAITPIEKNRFVDLAIQQYRILCTSPTINPSTNTTPSFSASFSSTPIIDLSSMCTRLSSVGAFSGLIDLVLTTASKRDSNNLGLHYYLNSKPQTDVEGEKYYNIRMDCYKTILETLDYLLSLKESCNEENRENMSNNELMEGISKPDHPRIILPSIFSSKANPTTPLDEAGIMNEDEIQLQINEMISTIVSSQDQLIHCVLFKWLISHNLSNLLLTLQSPFIEQFLKIESTAGFAEKNEPLLQRQMFDLLAKYLMKQSKFVDAAKILDALALQQGNHLTLKERLDHMTRASLCLQSTTSLNNIQGAGEFLHEIQDKVEVILLQIEVAKEVEKSEKNEFEINRALEQLNSQIFGVSELYENFASTFDLSSCKLAILQCCGHIDSLLIESLWREIINKELTSSKSEDCTSRLEKLKTLLNHLSKLYYKSHNYFPLDFLIKYLEQLSISNSFFFINKTWVVDLFIQLDIDLIQIHEAYEKAYKSKNPFWKNHNQPNHLIEVDSYLMVHFIKKINENKVPAESSALVNFVNGISLYLIDLQSSLEQDLPLISKLKELQIKLERLQINKLY